MKDILELENKLVNMTTQELFDYARRTYPDIPDMGFGKKKLVVRRIVNYERNNMKRQ